MKCPNCGCVKFEFTPKWSHGNNPYDVYKHRYCGEEIYIDDDD